MEIRNPISPFNSPPTFLAELWVRHRNSEGLRPFRTFWENQLLLSERGMREFYIRILSEEQIPLNSICHISSGIPIPVPLYSVEHLVRSVLHIVRLIRNDPRYLSMPILSFHLQIASDEIGHLQFLPLIFEAISSPAEPESAGGLVQLQQLDNSIILDGESFEEVPILLKEEKVEDSTNCSICLESVSVGKIVARLPCSHLYHTTCIIRWLHKKPTCPLCRAPVV
ncbi:hypothetical protein ACOSQ3_022754 [Xanthoceras sorbifolium]